MVEKDKSHAKRLKPERVLRALKRMRGVWAVPRARLALCLEEAAAAFFPLILFACGVAAFVLSGAAMLVANLAPAVHDALRALVLLGVAGFLISGFVRLWRRRDVMSGWRARRRVETLSALAHAPLTALCDRPVKEGHPWSAALWRRHLRAMARRFALAEKRGEVTGGRLMPPLAGIDPWGLRMVAVAALLLSWLAAGENASARLYGFSFPASRALDFVALSAWLEPPAYTGLAAVRLSGGEGNVGRSATPATPGAPIDVASGSVFHGLWHDESGGGSGEAPRLVLKDAGGVRENVEFGALASSSWTVEAPLDEEAEGGLLNLAVVSGGRPHASWPLRFIPDRPPQAHLVALERPPFATTQDFAYAALDDYGVKSLSLHMEAELEAEQAGAGGVCRPAARYRNPVFDLAVGPARPSVEGRTMRDMTSHPLAGAGVSVWLEAADALMQTEKSAALSLRLPERGVSRPEARNVMALRKTLFCAQPSLLRVAEGLASVAAALRSATPQASASDSKAADGLAAASSELRGWESGDAAGDAFNKAVDDVAMRLWRIALALDGWQGADVARRLEETLEALDEAVARGDAAAMEDHAAVLREILQGAMEGEALEAWLQGLALALEEARAGAGDAARERLKRLKESLALWEAESFADRALEALAREIEALRKKQDELRQRTAEAVAPREQESKKKLSGKEERSDPSPSFEALSERQDALAGALRRLLEESGSSAGAEERAPLRRALEGQLRAREALKESDAATALEGQTQALRGLDEAYASSRRRAGGKAGGQRLDPLGRPLRAQKGQGRLQDGSVDLPQGASLRESHRVLRALRERLNKSAPRSEERRYLQRLLPRY